MNKSRQELKAAIIRLIDPASTPHPLGHQGAYANRHVIQAPGGTPMELMFEKSEKTPANLWCIEKAVGSLLGGSIPYRRSPAAELWQKTNKAGEKQYGRHSALEKMPQLGDADLVCFQVETVAQAKQVIDALHEASARRLRP